MNFCVNSINNENLFLITFKSFVKEFNIYLRNKHFAILPIDKIQEMDDLEKVILSINWKIILDNLPKYEKRLKYSFSEIREELRTIDKVNKYKNDIIISISSILLFLIKNKYIFDNKNIIDLISIIFIKDRLEGNNEYEKVWSEIMLKTIHNIYKNIFERRIYDIDYDENYYLSLVDNILAKFLVNSVITINWNYELLEELFDNNTIRDQVKFNVVKELLNNISDFDTYSIKKITKSILKLIANKINNYKYYISIMVIIDTILDRLLYLIQYNISIDEEMIDYLVRVLLSSSFRNNICYKLVHRYDIRIEILRKLFTLNKKLNNEKFKNILYDIINSIDDYLLETLTFVDLKTLEKMLKIKKLTDKYPVV